MITRLTDEPRPRIAAPDAARIAYWTLRLVRAAWPDPPGDRQLVAATAAYFLREEVPSAKVALHAASAEVVNVVARVRGAGPRSIRCAGHRPDRSPARRRKTASSSTIRNVLGCSA
jgi:hypothetical protein